MHNSHRYKSLEFIQNLPAIARWGRQNCKGNTTLYEYNIHTRKVNRGREQGGDLPRPFLWEPEARRPELRYLLSIRPTAEHPEMP